MGMFACQNKRARDDDVYTNVESDESDYDSEDERHPPPRRVRMMKRFASAEDRENCTYRALPLAATHQLGLREHVPPRVALGPSALPTTLNVTKVSPRKFITIKWSAPASAAPAALAPAAAPFALAPAAASVSLECDVLRAEVLRSVPKIAILNTGARAAKAFCPVATRALRPEPAAPPNTIPVPPRSEPAALPNVSRRRAVRQWRTEPDHDSDSESDDEM